MYVCHILDGVFHIPYDFFSPEKAREPGFSLSSVLEESEEMVPRSSRPTFGEVRVSLDENNTLSASGSQALRILCFERPRPFPLDENSTLSAKGAQALQI